MPKAAPRDCPCHSGLRYAACCGPFHRRVTEAPTPEAMMRSRYAAFVQGEGAYLFATLAASHPDRMEAEGPAIDALCRAGEGHRYLALHILHASHDDREGEVLFYARVFARGVDRSFAELSTFVREESAWRYSEGLLIPRERLPADPRTLTRADFA